MPAAAATTALARPRPRIYAAASRPRIWIERLERRRVLSTTFENGIVTLRGTDQPDDYALGFGTDHAAPGEPGSLVDTAWIQEEVHGGNTTVVYNLRDVRGIVIEAGAGNDIVTVERDYSQHGIPMTVLGGAGDDTLTGGSADDLLDGQDGNDSIVASGGNDTTPDAPWVDPGRDPILVYDRHDRLVGHIHLDPDTGALVVTGTDADEVIEIAVPEGQPSVIGVWINEVLTVVPRTAVTSIRVDAGNGNDIAYLYSWGQPISVPVTLIGGAGNDLLYGQWYMTGYPHDLEPLDPNTVGPLTIFGGEGNDTLYGGAGDSYLDAGPGTDRMEPRGHHTTFVDPPDPDPTPAPQPESPETPTADPSDQTPADPTPAPTGGPPALTSTPPAASSNASPLFTSDDSLLSQHREDVWS